MKVTVGGEVKEYKDGLTVKELIEVEEVQEAEYVTVALNEDFVPRDEFETKQLKEGDTVEFLYFMGGGRA